MPHNKTRLWVGLAIAAVTIPAVGTYYVRSTDDNLKKTPILAAGRWDTSNAEKRTASARTLGRDYAAELDALLAKQASTTPPTMASSPPVQDDDDSEFDVSPLPSDEDDSAIDSDLPAATSVLSDPTASPAPTKPATVASETDPTVSTDGVPVQSGLAQASPAYPNGDLSDGDVYRVVMSNLSAEDQDRFVQAYAAMSTQQRADLLDSFRTQMQGNGQ